MMSQQKEYNKRVSAPSERKYERAPHTPNIQRNLFTMNISLKEME
jgi:hypothetical protein